MNKTPVSEQDRIESLDVLRGFALLGILLLNILGFGMLSNVYTNPGAGMTGSLDVFVWGAVDVFAEGAMRCLFSVLFGAGVVMFTSGSSGSRGSLHYRRTFWLLIFGLIDAYILLWEGDILTNYAVGGAILYFVRNVRPGRLITAAGILIIIMSLMYLFTQIGLGMAKDAAEQVALSDDTASLSEEVLSGAEQWEEFIADFEMDQEAITAELDARRSSYLSAFAWNREVVNEMMLFTVPLILFWDALAMMLLGMALYKYGVLQAQRNPTFYLRLMLSGFAVGLVVNLYEVQRAFTSDFAFLESFAFAQFTYQFGRLGMAMGYIGLIMLIVQKGMLAGFRNRLACVGRMALTNYLMHSVICLFVFTGAGFALVGTFTRAQLYIVVIAIWALQLILSPFWLKRYKYGPAEWLWRGLTYGRWPKIRIAPEGSSPVDIKTSKSN